MCKHVCFCVHVCACGHVCVLHMCACFFFSRAVRTVYCNEGAGIHWFIVMREQVCIRLL